MLVGERMTHPVIKIPPDMPIVEAINLMKRERVYFERVPGLDLPIQLVLGGER
ncbi:MAG TPA: CBS domain-containing protein, partial [bacterium]|nr:CBS domain-containing protein [bacterium]